MDIAIALQHGWDKPDFNLNGETYAGLVWRGPGQKPTETEIAQAWSDYNNESGRRDARKRLDATDDDLARVVEDLIDILVTKTTIAIEDLPIDAQQKLIARKNLRAKAKT